MLYELYYMYSCYTLVAIAMVLLGTTKVVMYKDGRDLDWGVGLHLHLHLHKECTTVKVLLCVWSMDMVMEYGCCKKARASDVHNT